MPAPFYSISFVLGTVLSFVCSIPECNCNSHMHYHTRVVDWRRVLCTAAVFLNCMPAPVLLHHSGTVLSSRSMPKYCLFANTFLNMHYHAHLDRRRGRPVCRVVDWRHVAPGDGAEGPPQGIREGTQGLCSALLSPTPAELIWCTHRGDAQQGNGSSGCGCPVHSTCFPVFSLALRTGQGFGTAKLNNNYWQCLWSLTHPGHTECLL